MIDIHKLSREWELLRRHPELAPFVEIRDAARQRRAPKPEAVEAIAGAVECLLSDEPARDRLEAFGRALGIVKRQGKGRFPDDSHETRLERLVHVRAVVEAEYELIALHGVASRAALSQALRETADREGIALRTLTRWVSELRVDAERAYLKFLRDLRSALDWACEPGADVEPLDPELERECRRKIAAVIPLLETSRHD